MDKQTLEEIRTIICNEYLGKKDEILNNELSGKIDSKRASEQRMKLIGMMTTVEIIQREIKKIKEDSYKCKECNKISVKRDIARATKNYLDIGLNYNKNYNIQVCPKCGTIFDNDEGFELIK